MNRLLVSCLVFMCFVSVTLLGVKTGSADSGNSAQQALPPVSQQIVREGDFAVKLQLALELGESDDEIVAESVLGEYGIAPRNGWIADYPVTPDILGELRKSLKKAVKKEKIDLSQDEAMKRLDTVAADFGLGVKPHESAAKTSSKAEAAVIYPDQAVIYHYYSTVGPPIITYYAPPYGYSYLYVWVPYPFWWAGLWFPGYFILNDFHRPYIYRNRTVFISNHYNDIRSHRVWRIDPVQRYSGRTYSGIGVRANRKAFIPTGVPSSEKRIFNAPRSRQIPVYKPSTTTPRIAPSVSAPLAPSATVAPSGQPAIRTDRPKSPAHIDKPARPVYKPSRDSHQRDDGRTGPSLRVPGGGGRR